jgi:hypothetical protein
MFFLRMAPGIRFAENDEVIDAPESVAAVDTASTKPEGTPVKAETIKVVIRVRPMNGKEQENNERMAVEIDAERSEIALRDDHGKLSKPWTFDGIFGPATEQDYFYENVASDIVACTFDGFNGTVFAYGQTGSGKTWSMVSYFEL